MMPRWPSGQFMNGHEIIPTRCCAGIKSVIDKHGETGRMSVHFRADESGRLLLTHAESVLDLTEEYTVKLPVAAKPSTTSPNDTAGIEEEVRVT